MDTLPQLFKDWFKEHLGEHAQDIATHGADCGFAHITYYGECVELYKRFEPEIWEMLVEDSESCGYKTPMEFVATFNRSNMADDPDTFKNLLVWYACERVAHELVNEGFVFEEVE